MSGVLLANVAALTPFLCFAPEGGGKKTNQELNLKRQWHRTNEAPGGRARSEPRARVARPSSAANRRWRAADMCSLRYAAVPAVASILQQISSPPQTSGIGSSRGGGRPPETPPPPGQGGVNILKAAASRSCIDATF